MFGHVFTVLYPRCPSHLSREQRRAAQVSRLYSAQGCFPLRVYKPLSFRVLPLVSAAGCVLCAPFKMHANPSSARCPTDIKHSAAVGEEGVAQGKPPTFSKMQFDLPIPIAEMHVPSTPILHMV